MVQKPLIHMHVYIYIYFFLFFVMFSYKLGGSKTFNKYAYIFFLLMLCFVISYKWAYYVEWVTSILCLLGINHGMGFYLHLEPTENCVRNPLTRFYTRTRYSFQLQMQDNFFIMVIFFWYFDFSEDTKQSRRVRVGGL